MGGGIQTDKQMSEKKIDFDTLEIDIKKLPLKVSGSIKKKKVLNSNFAKENVKSS